MTDGSDGSGVEKVVHVFGRSWTQMHGANRSPIDSHLLGLRVAAAAAEAFPETIDVAELVGVPSGDDDSYGEALVLSGGRLHTMRVTDRAITVSFLGELIGGVLEEELVVEDEDVLGRTLRYTHPRLPGGEMLIKVESNRRAKELHPLRELLRRWSTTARGGCGR